MNTGNLNICISPFAISWNNKSRNLLHLEELLKDIHPSTDLLILPETFSTGFPVGLDKEEVSQLLDSSEGETILLLKKLAAENNMAIVGSIIAEEDSRLFNRVYFIEPGGEIFFSDKAHLFRMGGENEIFTSGKKRLEVRYRGWNIAIVVCYDIRFPVWCRNKNKEYDILIAVANWPRVRNEVWTSLLKARAIENIAYVCGVNCSGVDSNDNVYDGKSLVYDFKGNDILIPTENPELSYSVLRKDSLEKFRQKFPVWMDADNFEIL